jgi:hypothetical protein
VQIGASILVWLSYRGLQAAYDAGYVRGKASGRIQALSLAVGIVLAAAMAWYWFIVP